MSLKEKVQKIEACTHALKKLIQEQKRLLKDGCRDEAVELEDAIERALLHLLEVVTEAELAVMEETAEKKDLKLNAPWKARPSSRSS